PKSGLVTKQIFLLLSIVTDRCLEMFRYNLLILHWPLVEGHFWSAIREKYAGKYSCTHKSTSASHEEMDIISQERLNLKAHVSVGFLIQTP
ncbi:hypothetical protein M2976_25650, partial [Klebsiella pneumoniae]|uniref:hypothetical protein n=1 Tax=Klebsiella pneumoniae TaxID=573 RepID=UPI00200FC047